LSTLGLVQYISHPTTQITFKGLQLPLTEALEIGFETKIALDDRLGIVYLQPTQSDTFIVISYA